MASTTASPSAADAAWTLSLSRTFDAPRQLVWDAWTHREHLMRWFCPKDFSVLSFDADVREGGSWRSVMRGPDGSEYVHFGTYRELDAPQRIVLTHAWEQNHQEPPADTVITVTFAEHGGRTTMTFEQVGLATEASRDSHAGGWGEAFDNLAAHVHAAGDDAERTLVISRVFHAPRKLVWEAYTQSEHLAKWYGPRGMSARIEKNDLRPGGQWRYIMIGPDGAEYPSEGVFREVVPMERIVTTDGFGDDHGFPDPDALPKGMIVTITFEDLDYLPVNPGRHDSRSDAAPKTRLTVRIEHPTAEERRKHEGFGVVAGFHSMLDCLDDHLLAQDDDRQIVVSREFDAPADMVFDAWSRPEVITHWWGPRGFSTTTHHMDFRTGGSWRFTMHGPDGADYPNHIEYDEVHRPLRIAYRHAGEGEHDAVRFHSTVTFVGRGGKTHLTLRMVFATAAARDEVATKYGAVEGARDTLARLAEIVEPH